MRNLFGLFAGAITVMTLAGLLSCSEDEPNDPLLILVRSELQPDPSVGVFVTAQARGGSSLRLRGIAARVYSRAGQPPLTETCVPLPKRNRFTFTYGVAVARAGGGALVGELYEEADCKGDVVATRLLSLVAQSNPPVVDEDASDGSLDAVTDAAESEDAADATAPEQDAKPDSEASSDAALNEGG